MKILSETEILDVVSKTGIKDTLASGIKRKLFFPDAEMPVSVKVTVMGELKDDDANILLVFKDDDGMVIDTKKIELIKDINDNKSTVVQYFLKSTNYISSVIANIVKFNNTDVVASVKVSLQILDQSFEEQSAMMLNSIPMYTKFASDVESVASGRTITLQAQLQKITEANLNTMNEVTMHILNSSNAVAILSDVDVVDGIMLEEIIANGTLCVVSDDTGLMTFELTNAAAGEYQVMIVNANGKVFLSPVLTWT